MIEPLLVMLEVLWSELKSLATSRAIRRHHAERLLRRLGLTRSQATRIVMRWVP